VPVCIVVLRMNREERVMICPLESNGDANLVHASENTSLVEPKVEVVRKPGGLKLYVNLER